MTERARLAFRDWPILLEAVDQRLFVAIHIVNHLLCGGMGTDPVDLASRNAIAELLTDEPADALLESHIAACGTEELSDARALIARLRERAFGMMPLIGGPTCGRSLPVQARSGSMDTGFSISGTHEEQACPSSNIDRMATARHRDPSV